MARAGELGADQALAFLREVDSINMRRRVRMVDLAREVLGGSIVGRRVAVLGAAFKPDSDDIRDSPALNVAAQMRLQGADVVVTDPAALENARRTWPDLHFAEKRPRRPRPGPTLVLLLTEWKEYRNLDPDAARRDRADQHDPRRPQRARPAALARGGLDLPGTRPPPQLGRIAPRRRHRRAVSPRHPRGAPGPPRAGQRVLDGVPHGPAEVARGELAGGDDPGRVARAPRADLGR